MSFPTKGFCYPMLTLLLDLSAKEVRARLGGGELVFIEQVYVGFESRTLVLGVRYTRDTGKGVCHVVITVAAGSAGNRIVSCLRSMLCSQG